LLKILEFHAAPSSNVIVQSFRRVAIRAAASHDAAAFRIHRGGSENRARAGPQIKAPPVVTMRKQGAGWHKSGGNAHKRGRSLAPLSHSSADYAQPVGGRDVAELS
jgi:hypothetical protein